VFLPGSTFLEKNGTFTNAERRIQMVRKVMQPRNGYEDWQVTELLSNALGYPMHYNHPSEIMDEIAALTPTFAGVSYKKLDELGSVQWPCNEAAPEGTPVMHINGFVRGKGKFVITEYVATDEKTGPRYPLLLTTGRILSQYNVGAQTRRTANVVWHEEDVLEIHPHIVDDGRLAEQADMGRLGRLGADLAALAFEALEQRGLLAAHIGAGADPHLHVEGVFGTGDIGPEHAAFAGALDRNLHGLDGMGIF
jgi:predicted molibdopterin-dependent oxidoreductase YjgC